MAKPILPVINWNNPLTKGLVFHTPIFEMGGSVLKNIAKQTNGVITNSTWVNSPFGEALNLNGTTSFVNFGLNSATNGFVKNFSIVVIFKAAGIVGDQKFIGNARLNSNNGFSFGLADNLVRFTTLGVFDYNSSISISAGVYYQVVVSMKTDNSVDFLLNGTFRQNVTNGSPGNANTDDALYLGALTANGTSTLSDIFTGELVSVSIYNRPIASSEVKSLYQNPWQIYAQPLQIPILNSLGAVIAAGQNYWRNLLGVGP